jgi:hypothetical protein
MGIGCFEFDQPLEQPVVFGITDQRIVEYMVLVIVLFELLPQLNNFVLDLNWEIFYHMISNLALLVRF